MNKNSKPSFFYKVLSGYLKPLRNTGVILFCAGLTALVSFIIVYPLWQTAVNARLVYNIISISIITLVILKAAATRVIKMGVTKSLLFLLSASYFIFLFYTPDQFFWVTAFFLLLNIGLIYLLKIKEYVTGGLYSFLLFLCYLNGIYWLSALFLKKVYYLFVPLVIIYIVFLGFILYEKKNQKQFPVSS